MYHVGSQCIVLFAVLYLRIFFDSVKETTGICIIFVSFYNILLINTTNTQTRDFYLCSFKRVCVHIVVQVYTYIITTTAPFVFYSLHLFEHLHFHHHHLLHYHHYSHLPNKTTFFQSHLEYEFFSK